MDKKRTWSSMSQEEKEGTVNGCLILLVITPLILKLWLLLLEDIKLLFRGAQ